LKAAEAIANLYNKIEKNEPNSHALFYDYAKVFARVVSHLLISFINLYK
jgi:hypothetical protein